MPVGSKVMENDYAGWPMDYRPVSRNEESQTRCASCHYARGSQSRNREETERPAYFHVSGGIHRPRGGMERWDRSASLCFGLGPILQLVGTILELRATRPELTRTTS